MKREAASAMRLIHRHLLAAILVEAAGGAVAAQTRDGRDAGPTGAIPPAAIAAPAGGPSWSGESGGSGDPRMTAEAIREGAANFRGCLERLWPLAARRGISRNVYAAYTASLTPDLRIMDLLDRQPEFTKSFWDYLDLLVNDARYWSATARPSTR
jgi:membrane-bound lytic murein transglycosylase B